LSCIGGKIVGKKIDIKRSDVILSYVDNLYLFMENT
jgi:hypothetical protein